MVEMIRVDDRLIHGQIVVGWTKYLSVDSIVVANDDVVNDPIALATLKIGCPADVKLAFRNIPDAIELLNNEKLSNRKILVIVSRLEDALSLIRSVKSVKMVNIGNYGRNIPDNVDRKVISEGLHVNEEEFGILKEICRTDIFGTVQLLPSSEKVILFDLIKKKEDQ